MTKRRAHVSRKRPSRQSEEVRVQVVLLAELVCDGDTGQVFAPVALHGVDVEEDGQGGEKAQKDQQEDTDLDPLPVHIGTPKAEDWGGRKTLLFCFQQGRKGGGVGGGGGVMLFIFIYSRYFQPH